MSQNNEILNIFVLRQGLNLFTKIKTYRSTLDAEREHFMTS